jgi:hypothetical protein
MLLVMQVLGAVVGNECVESGDWSSDVLKSRLLPFEEEKRSTAVCKYLQFNTIKTGTLL